LESSEQNLQIKKDNDPLGIIAEIKKSSRSPKLSVEKIKGISFKGISRD
jgi:hypothetical protein